MAWLKRLPSRLRSAPPRIAPRAKVALPFYKSAEWRALVGKLIKQRGRECCKCGAKGGRIYADHRVELKDGGSALDERNIDLLCASCHGRKTELKRRERAGLA